jgi:hypothetical protein
MTSGFHENSPEQTAPQEVRRPSVQAGMATALGPRESAARRRGSEYQAKTCVNTVRCSTPVKRWSSPWKK